MGYWVRVDSRFSSANQADDIVNLFKKEGFVQAKTRYTAEDGLNTSGPWVINILAVRPSFTGQLKSALATDIIPGKETTTSLSKRLGAFAAINAGYPHTTGNGSLRCYPGDSGSPWFAGTTGYGIMHACFWQSPEDSSTPVTVSIYTSLDYLNSIGTTIVTQ